MPAVHGQHDGGGKDLPLAVHRVQILQPVRNIRERCKSTEPSNLLFQCTLCCASELFNPGPQRWCLGTCAYKDQLALFLQDQLLFCDDCDRGYHMYCLSPPMSEPPEGMCYVFKIDVFKNEIKNNHILNHYFCICKSA